MVAATSISCHLGLTLPSRCWPVLPPTRPPIKARIEIVKASRMPIAYSLPTYRSIKCAAVSGENHFWRTHSSDKHDLEPVWLSFIKDVIWGFRSLVLFLIEQPSQLRYIEWPTFQNTLKTATLTLVLVAALIVALSSIDSALSFLLALFLRRTV